MVLEFNVKFFFVAMILALVSGVFHYFNIWLVLYELPISLYPWIAVVLAPVQLVFGVVLPFAVMYVLGTRIGSDAVKSVIVSTFLGCWTGGVAVLAVHTYLMRGSYGYDYLFQLVLWTIWEIFAKALSGVFFVSFAAILFAHYQRTVNK